MSLKSKIEWTDATWNPWRGCTKVSEGCTNCYAERESKRFGKDFSKVVRAADKTFYAPLGWKDPLKIFACSGSDFFHEDADELREEAWDIIEKTPQHTYLLLTKRPERIRTNTVERFAFDWPLPNVHLGVTTENQEQFGKRVYELLKVPATMRFLSIEPMLEPIHIRPAYLDPNPLWDKTRTYLGIEGTVNWVIVGGESGPKARPMHIDWARSVRDQCQAAGVPFFFKQWGEHAPRPAINTVSPTGPLIGWDMVRVGKKRAGRLLDGREWNEMPLP